MDNLIKENVYTRPLYHQLKSKAAIEWARALQDEEVITLDDDVVIDTSQSIPTNSSGTIKIECTDSDEEIMSQMNEDEFTTPQNKKIKLNFEKKIETS